MLKHIQEHRHRPFGVLHKGIYMILQELHSASSNQHAASLHSEAPSGELWKLDQTGLNWPQPTKAGAHVIFR